MNITTKCRNSKLLRMFRFTCTSHVHFQQLCQLVILTFSNEHDENNSLKTKLISLFFNSMWLKISSPYPFYHNQVHYNHKILQGFVVKNFTWDRI